MVAHYVAINGCHCPQVQQLRQNVFSFGRRISGEIARRFLAINHMHAANPKALNILEHP